MALPGGQERKDVSMSDFVERVNKARAEQKEEYIDMLCAAADAVFGAALMLIIIFANL